MPTVIIQLNNNLEQGTKKNASVKNINSCFQLGKTLLSASITAMQWTSWWTGTLVINTAISALPGVIVGTMIGSIYANFSTTCIEEKNSYAVDRCNLTSTETGYGALYGAASTGLIGTALTIVGLFKDPTIDGAKDSMIARGCGLATCKK